MLVSNPVGHESIVRGRRERGVDAQRDDVAVREGISVRIILIRHLRSRHGTLVVRMMGVTVIVSRVVVVVVAVVLANIMRMLHLDRQIGACHVNERDGDDQQSLEEGSHAILGKIRQKC